MIKTALTLIFLLCFSLRPLAGDQSAPSGIDLTRKAFIDSIYNDTKPKIENQQFYAALQAYYLLTDSLVIWKDYDQLISHYQSILYIFRRLNNKELLQRHIRIYTELGKHRIKPISRVRIDFNVAQVHLTLHKNDSARILLYHCVYNMKHEKDPFLLGRVYQTLGDLYIQPENYGLAIFNYKKAYEQFLIANEPDPQSHVLTRISHIYDLLNQNDLNLAYNFKALAIRQKPKKQPLIASSFINIASAYKNLKMQDSVMHYLNKALQIARQINNYEYLEVVYKAMRDHAISLQNEKDAYLYTMKYAEYRKANLKSKNDSEILIVEANKEMIMKELENEQTRQEIRIRDLEITNTRNKIAITSLSAFGFFLLILLIGVQTKKNRKKNEELELLNKSLVKEILENDTMTEQLNQSEERHRFLADNTNETILRLSPDLSIIYISNACNRLFGYETEEVISMKNFELAAESNREVLKQGLSNSVAGSTPGNFVFTAERKNGLRFWAEARVNPVIDNASGKLSEVIAVIRDYSEQKHSEEFLTQNARQKELLLSEIHNRIKNNFAILASLVSLVTLNRPDLEYANAFRELQLRIRTMALVHERLYKSTHINVIQLDLYLRNLCTIIAGSYGSPDISLETSLDPVPIPIETALPVGLIINELIINAYKYAFPSNTRGIITIGLQKSGAGIVTISVHDNGIGLPEHYHQETENSMGSQIVNLLVQQIEGELKVTSDSGTCFRIEFPVKIT